MKRRRIANQCDITCPVRKAMNVLDGKWTLLIVRELLGGKKRFGELLCAIEGVSPKVLAQRLKLLEDEQVLTKVVYPEVPPRVEYELKERGQQLRTVVNALTVWGAAL